MGTIIRDAIRKRLEEVRAEDKVKAGPQADNGFGEVVRLNTDSSSTGNESAESIPRFARLTVLSQLT
ncbi:MAG: hypothetical protein R3F37_19900 [Candidatus Competibacteraceae bacterium]